MNITPIIRITDLHKSFNDRQILQGINLTIKEGESVVIIGFSGSGKSVLLKHIIGFLEPDEGTVEINGQIWQELDGEQQLALRRMFGMVFQEAALFDGLTIGENIALPMEIRQDISLSPYEIQDKTISLLAEVGLEADVQRRPVELSGGMQKRAGIARALVVNPKIILYDEPTAGLDGTTGERISQLIHKVNQEHPGVTSVTVTHDYSCAALIADRILYLDKHTGTLQELTSKIQKVRTSSQGEEERRNNVRGWLEKFFEKKETTAERAENPASSFQFVPYVLNGLSHFFTVIGQLFFLFFEMGFPLRKKDVVERIFVLGIHSFPMIVASGFFIGMIGMVQFYVGVGDMRDLLPTPLPATLSMVLLKILSPLFVGILLAGRIGSHISAEVGTKKLLKQLDALESLAISPTRFLLSPIVIALALTVPVMSILSTLAGMFGGYMIWVSFGESGSYYWSVAPAAMKISDLFYALSKSAVIGIIIGVVSYQQGTEEKQSSEDIATATTRTVLIASMLIVIFDFFVSYVYTRYIG